MNSFTSPSESVMSDATFEQESATENASKALREIERRRNHLLDQLEELEREGNSIAEDMGWNPPFSR